MKYLSLNTVVSAFNTNRHITKSSFWGLLSVFAAIDKQVNCGVSFPFHTNLVSNLLEGMFNLSDNKKEYLSDSIWYIVLSRAWIDKVEEQMFIDGKKPNAYTSAIWFLRNFPFADDATQDDVLNEFVTRIHLSKQDFEALFSLQRKDVVFSPTKYKEMDLYAEIKKLTSDYSQNTTVSAEGNFVKSNAGELSRAPFVQTMYSSTKSTECLLLTTFDVFEEYSSKPLESNKFQQEDRYQTILYGCPGGGKSHKVSKFLEERGVAEKFQIRTTFHPDTDYTSFVGCYKPSMKDGNIEYNYSAQVFTEAYVKAWKNPEESVYLIIEEINRGNCAQIFGDLFQLLDRDKNTGISQYPIKADKDLADYLRREDVLGAEHEGIKDGKLRLPSNLIIYATMNTSDQSLFPMDSAFKRRWDWEYVPIDYSANKDSFHFTIKIGDAEYSWIKFLENVNDKITKVTHSEDKQMGNYFIKKSISQEEFVNKVMFYIWNEVCKEEWNTDGNFFRRKDNKEFKFTDLFTTEAEAILNEFMIETIGIQPIGKEDK